MMTYLPGETVRVTVVGKVGQAEKCMHGWPDLHIDVEDKHGGITLPVPLRWNSVKVDRIIPAAGMPKPGELWRNSEGTELFVITDGFGYLKFTSADGRSYDLDWLNDRCGPLVPVRLLPEGEPEAGDNA